MEFNKQLFKQQVPDHLNPITFNISDFSLSDSFLAYHHQNPQQPPQIFNSSPSLLHPAFTSTQNIYADNCKKRKAEAQSTSTTSQQTVSPSASTVTTRKEKNNLEKGKKWKNKESSGDEKMEQVIHVRAKRGQATDSHSIAERVRREKINNKLRCLQDLVPGCHKSMGMAVMLEEIINYVHSLQNQVEFLSMELAAASCSYYDLNLETESSKKAQVPNANGAGETQKWLRERYGEASYLQTTWPI